MDDPPPWTSHCPLLYFDVHLFIDCNVPFNLLTNHDDHHQPGPSVPLDVNCETADDPILSVSNHNNEQIV